MSEASRQTPLTSTATERLRHPWFLFLIFGVAVAILLRAWLSEPSPRTSALVSVPAQPDWLSTVAPIEFSSEQAARDALEQTIIDSRTQLEAAAQIALNEFSDVPTSDAQKISKNSAATPMVGWVVVVNAFRSEARAQALRAELEQAGLGAFIEVNTQGEHVRYEVHVGPEIKLEAAQAVRDKLITTHNHALIKAFIP